MKKRNVVLCIFVLGFLYGATGPDPSRALVSGGCFVILAGFIYIPCKLLSDLGDHIAHYRDEDPNRPYIKNGDSLTEYDSTMARRTGEEVAKALREHKREGGEP